MRRDVIVLGSTGSIGTQALDVIGRHRDVFRVVGLAAGAGHPDLLAEQAAMFDVPRIAVATAETAATLEAALAARGVRGTRIEAGEDAAPALAGQPCDVVLNAITGFAGLTSTLATLSAGTSLALANKESLVAGRGLVTGAAAPGQIVPVDSEHSALAQALRSGRASEVRRLLVTASGGPFRGWSRAELATVTPQQALAHPTWAMGRVVTINSATLVNKGLEVLEAALLFDLPLDRVDVVVHPQSVVHSMVEFHDGAVIAQASPPDMRLPIALGLSWPERLDDVAAACDWSSPTAWTFEPLDDMTFPAVGLARQAGTDGGTAPTVFNAANEICVDAFCDGRLAFTGIVDTIASVLEAHRQDSSFTPDERLSLEAVLAADAWARQEAARRVDADDPPTPAAPGSADPVASGAGS
ncbi:MAG: 1-deoxy-D-xylulose-5-phosphate reductoisomerase [Propionibacteriaceae bacterium]|jgi:1-deoxy-D-xylulose-5-phosphate reductoisomerase|nr:1-deoxy-D-xylulose-5-phosphate reductoisomerase [Propionibacteriaceae bacterium]